MNCIVNVSRNWGIGMDGDLLVHLSEDLRFFRENTQGCAVILGRKTLATFPGGKPLKNRRNIVLTRSSAAIEGAELCGSIPEALRLAEEAEKQMPCWVIGGAEVYRQLLPYCTLALVTKTEIDTAADAY
ncbi:MAG: dihydrofolate reductase, partial [Oscillospiraceae bacterium]|nr:dihydrofolate reductase [Oscillospiraceae bacterium]